MSDTVLGAMMAIYNATSTLPAADSVVKMYNIHHYNTEVLRYLHLIADKNAGYMMQIKNGNMPTGFVPFDALLTKYHLAVSSHGATPGMSNTAYSAYLTTDSNWNMKGVGAEFLTLPNMWYAEKKLMPGDGHRITVNNVTDTSVDITYSFGWGDCPSGCMWRHNWHFRVNSSCDVTFKGSSGDPVVGVGVPVTKFDAIRIYPNPAKDALYIEGVAEAEYVIHNMKGEQVAKGQTEGKISVEVLPPGVYVIGLQQGEKFGIYKLVKE
jgi:hypothetical protein